MMVVEEGGFAVQWEARRRKELFLPVSPGIVDRPVVAGELLCAEGL